MKKLALAFLLFSLGAASAHAATYLVLTVNASDFTCTSTTLSGIKEGIALDSWSWGAMTPVTGSNGVSVSPSGLPALSVLSLTKTLDQCSAQLVNLSLKAQVLATVTMTEYDTNTQGELAASIVVTLDRAILSSYQVSGATGADPSEFLAFTFQKICLTTEGSSPTNVCYSAGAI
jgi:type VI protein secretion system component Hcp